MHTRKADEIRGCQQDESQSIDHWHQIAWRPGLNFEELGQHRRPSAHRQRAQYGSARLAQAMA